MQPVLNSAVEQLLAREERRQRKPKNRVRVDREVLQKAQEEREEIERLSKADAWTLEKSIGRLLDRQGDAERLAFESDPTVGKWGGIFKQKQRLLPDRLLKRIAIQDDLVASIVQARQNQISAFGRPRPDRFSTGFVIEARQETLERIESIQDEEEKRRGKRELQQRIARASKRLMTCGDESLDLRGVQDRLTFPQYLFMSARNAVVLGRIATEIIYRVDPNAADKRRFAGFRVIDAGTIYRAEPQKPALDAVRDRARQLLQELKGDKDKPSNIDPNRFEQDDYAWVQVIEERPVQAFTDKECIVHNFYPVPDFEMDGYPVTPLDTAIAAVTTHINIVTHNKLYFQSGRAARGMLVIKSDDCDDGTLARVRQQFNAQINSVSNAWRMPVFAVGSDDDITWQPIDSGGRDMEFQYLADANARTILSAFGMAPEELPGWSYLSRGTNNQALSESNNEYKLEAARDVGIRPLLAQFEDFLNQSIMPLLDPELAKDAVIKLVGLDAETAEKESVRIQQDMPVHMTYDEVLERVEKKALGKRLGGEFPLNPQFQAILDKYVPVGVIQEEFFGLKGASKDPQWAYCRDQFWFSWQQMMQAQAQMQQQQAAAAQQQQGQNVNPSPPDGGGGGGQGDAGGGGQESSGGGEETEKQKTKDVQEASASPAGGQSGGGDLTRSLDQAIGLLSKSEAQLPPEKKKLLAAHKQLMADFMEGFERDRDRTVEEILEAVRRLPPNRPKA